MVSLDLFLGGQQSTEDQRGSMEAWVFEFPPASVYSPVKWRRGAGRGKKREGTLSVIYCSPRRGWLRAGVRGCPRTPAGPTQTAWPHSPTRRLYGGGHLRDGIRERLVAEFLTIKFGGLKWNKGKTSAQIAKFTLFSELNSVPKRGHHSH